MAEYTKNEKLFLKINHYAGKHAGIDALMIFSARWLLAVMVLIVFLYTVYALPNLYVASENSALEYFIEIALLFGIPLTIGLAINWVLGLVTHWARPIIVFGTKSTQLIHVLQNFKTFPSDHAMASASIVATCVGIRFFSGYFSTTGLHDVILLFLALSATLVSISRVYCGVHFPRDIVVGTGIGIFASLLWFHFLY